MFCFGSDMGFLIMKLTAMANELQHQLEDPATYAALGFEDRLSLLTDAEWGRRQANKLARYIKNATFSMCQLVLNWKNAMNYVMATGLK